MVTKKIIFAIIICLCFAYGLNGVSSFDNYSDEICNCASVYGPNYQRCICYVQTHGCGCGWYLIGDSGDGCCMNNGNAGCPNPFCW